MTMKVFDEVTVKNEDVPAILAVFSDIARLKEMKVVVKNLSSGKTNIKMVDPDYEDKEQRNESYNRTRN